MFAIGSSLKEARLRKGLDLAAAAEATKIRSRHLQALEDEQFDVLPGQTYVRGFLKTYADFLDLDGQLYVDEYSSRFWVNEDGSPSPRRVRIRRKHHRRIELNMVILTLVAIVGVTTLVIAAWKFGGTNETTPKPAVRKPAAPRTVVHRPLAKLTVTAVKGNSLIDVRALRSPGRAGRLLYHGTLERGKSQTFVNRGLWLIVDSPKHVVLSLNGGTPLALGGVCPRSVEVTPQQMTSTVSCR
jgi:hypothetical protein